MTQTPNIAHEELVNHQEEARARNARNLIVLADGTGNSASKLFKTNVWRLYQAIALTDGSQVAVFGDGVGTSSIKILRVLGLALGVGVKRNVLNLYTFLCRNYTPGDRIWAFGFSRGAFTVRALVGLIYHEGLVSFNSEAELQRNALAAYRAYRRKAFPTLIPWVVASRFLRDRMVSAWNAMTGARAYAVVKQETAQFHRDAIKVHFLGVWDTVVAYGLPIDELTRAVDKWVWPMKFRDDSLLRNVQHARHALSLDDERRTFHPLPWNESIERELSAHKCVPEGRLRQVWFAGAHSDVGGGYPDDGLSFVSLCWMIEEAADKGLRFESTLVAAYAAAAAPTGRIYDPRAGFGALWRYQPRDTQLLLGQGNRPLVHGSVMTRMVCGNDGYAPISLPEEIDVLPPHGTPVAFDTAAVSAELAQVTEALAQPVPPAQEALKKQHRVLTHTWQLVEAANAQACRPDLFKLVLDTVWWRRVVYFISLALVLIAVAFPLLAQYLRIEGFTDHLNDRAGGPVGWTLGFITGFVPGFAEPWVTAVVRSSAQATMLLIGLLASLRLSGFLRGRICDRARTAWNVQMQIDGMALDRLRPTGQRHALATATLVFVICAIAALLLGGRPWLVKLCVSAATICGGLWAFRMLRPAISVDPAQPGWLLGLARALRTSPSAVRTYRYVAQTLAPLGFLLLSGLLVLSLVHRAVFDLLSTGGTFCQATHRGDGQSEPDEQLGGATFQTDAICHATGLRLIAGRQYRIRIDMDTGVAGEWFDKSIRTDVAGFSAASMRHYLASPLKRWWRENWFQPIARVGEVGNYEHVLQPVAPLPTVRLMKCRPPTAQHLTGWDAIKDTPSPASTEFKQAQLECEAGKGLRPNRVLIADMTADATGELFLYVNDAVLTLPGLTNVFFRNNSGTAKVTVQRILATSVMEP
jgi:uncharacterized protein (DUF2235 family)